MLLSNLSLCLLSAFSSVFLSSEPDARSSVSYTWTWPIHNQNGQQPLHVLPLSIGFHTFLKVTDGPLEGVSLTIRVGFKLCKEVLLGRPDSIFYCCIELELYFIFFLMKWVRQFTELSGQFLSCSLLHNVYFSLKLFECLCKLSFNLLLGAAYGVHQCFILFFIHRGCTQISQSVQHVV